MKTISFRLDEHNANLLDLAVKKSGRTKSFYIKQAILNYLPVIENISEYNQEFKQIIKDYEYDKNNNKLVTYSHDEVLKKLDL